MEKEKLIIKNFGPIKDVELDLSRFTILIGEQATGKSTVAKVLAVCRYFSYIVDVNSVAGPIPEIMEGLDAWGLIENVKSDSYISYNCRHYELVIEPKKIDKQTAIDFPNQIFLQSKVKPLSQEFKNLLIELDKIRPKTRYPWRASTSFFINDVKRVMDNPFYLPTERGLQSIFSLGQGSIPNLANFLYNYFSKVDGTLRFFKTETEIEPLGIKYKNKNGIGYVKKKNEKKFRLLSNAASGYQSIIPVILVMKYQNEIRKKGKTFIIEEPELNLFPTAQYELVKYFVGKNSEENNMIIATHSPYILASINNLLLAGKYGNDEVAKIVPKKYWLDINDVSAYMLLSDGKAEDIIDKESGQIKAEKIDSASQIIGNEYEKIMGISYP